MAPYTWGGSVEIPGPAFPFNLVFGFIEFLLSLFGLGGPNLDVLVTGINNTWQNLLQSSSFIYNSLGFLGGAVDAILGSVVKAIEHIFVDIIQGVLLKILNEILALFKKLHDFLAPLIAWLKRLQAMQRQFQMQYMRKIIDLIQRARKVLVIFRLLHLKFAQQLDTYLARFEGDLAGKWVRLVQYLNAIVGVLDTVLDPRLLLRPGHQLASLGQAIGAVQQAVGALGFRTLLCIPADNPAQPVTEPWAATSARISHEMATHTGDYALYERQRDDTLRQFAIDLGVTPLV